jgi:hypothetical protein
MKKLLKQIFVSTGVLNNIKENNKRAIAGAVRSQ